MAHLVASLIAEPPMPIQDALHLIREAHLYLVQHGFLASNMIQNVQPSSHWGTDVKRTQVNFSTGKRPVLINETIQNHSFTEVYNQCATIERLIDALEWAAHELPDYQVACCHPSTGSNKKNVLDNDLILIDPQGGLARFEVSDVVSSEKDSNRKEHKDLKSLGVLDGIGFQENYRLFMVVSAEFGNILRRKKKNQPYRYHEQMAGDFTSIFEILPAN